MEVLNFVIENKILYVLLIITICYIGYRLITKSISYSFNLKFKNFNIGDRRQKTINTLTNSIVKYVFIFIAIFSLLGLFGVDTTTILASIGIAGLAIGLAVQDTLKDVLAGFFILIENQYAIGDVITIGSFKGEVISLGIKTTKLKSETGEIRIIPNRNIVELTNHSLSLVRINIDLELESDKDVEKVLKDFVIKQNKNKTLNVNIQYAGIQKLGSKVTYRLVVEMDIKKQEVIYPEILAELKKELDKKKIR